MALKMDADAILIARNYVEDNKFNFDRVLLIEQECFRINGDIKYNFTERTVSKYAISYCNYFEGTL